MRSVESRATRRGGKRDGPPPAGGDDFRGITNGVVADGHGVFHENGTILTEAGCIAAVGDAASLDSRSLEDAGGRLIVPGFLNAHHHLYSSLAVGLRPRGNTGSFLQILENLWWPLDAALEERSVYISALTGIVDAVRHGTTMIFDHHASMSFVQGSLETVAGAFRLAGLRGSLCFEVSDRHGIEEARRHVEENLSFHDSCRESPLLTAMMGLHANLTLSEQTLRFAAEVRPEELPVHIHCGEARIDLEHCRELGYEGPVDRLHRFGLLDRRSILAHAVHLSDADYRLLGDHPLLVVTNPESNANNRVGTMDARRIERYVLGTDGMSGDMVATLRSLLLLSDHPEAIDPGEVFFRRRAEAQEKFFPGTGTFRRGAAADIAILDYIPSTPIRADNLVPHLLYGARGGPVYMTVCNGRILYRDGLITFTDEAELRREARQAAAELWRRCGEAAK